MSDFYFSLSLIDASTRQKNFSLDTEDLNNIICINKKSKNRFKDKLLELLCEFSKSTGFKINIKISIVFLYAINRHLEIYF